jgi:hypothetical protein
MCSGFGPFTVECLTLLGRLGMGDSKKH